MITAMTARVTNEILFFHRLNAARLFFAFSRAD